MRLLPLRALVLLPLAAAPASAGDGENQWYAEIGVGLNQPLDSEEALGGDIEYDEGFAYRALIGRQLGHPFGGERLNSAIELEFIYSEADVSSDGLITAGGNPGDRTDTTAFMANYVLDLELSPSVTGYAGIGVGFADVSFETQSGPNTPFGDTGDTNFAWQFKTGLRCHLGRRDQFAWTVGYRFLQTSDVDVESEFALQSFELENSQHQLEIGLRWNLSVDEVR